MTSILHEPQVIRALRPPTKTTVSQWADRNRVLSEFLASEPGRWDSSRTPFSIEWMNSANDPWVREITLVTGTQVSKSETLNNILGFFVCHRPSPAMFVLPGAARSREVMQHRIMPMIRDCDVLRRELTVRKHDTKAREIKFRRSVLFMRSAESESELASFPTRLVLCDEVDKWPRWSGKEAAPLALVRERVATYADHLIVKASTPTTEGSAIDVEFRLGDQRRYHVPCPHCGAYQLLEWKQFRYDQEKITTVQDMQQHRLAWYECAACAGAIRDVHKRELLARGVWVPEGWTVEDWVGHGRAADRCPHRSYHLWAAYSPWRKFWQVVAQYLLAREDPALAMNWTNSWLAENFADTVENTSDEMVKACHDHRDVFEIPEKVRLLTAAVDVQKDRLEWCVQGWGEDEEAWVIAAGRIPKQPDGRDWLDLTKVLWRNRWGSEANPHRVRLAVIDSRHRRDEVVDWARQHGPLAAMIAGVATRTGVPLTMKKHDRHPRTGMPLKSSLLIWSADVDYFKGVVSSRLSRALETGSTETAGRIWIPNGLPDGWEDQITSEHLVRKRRGARDVLTWEKKPGRRKNEAWDLLVYNAIAGHLLHLHTLRSEGRQAPRRPAPKPPPKRDRSRAPRHPRF